MICSYRPLTAWALSAALALLLAAAPSAARASDEGASWQFAPAEAPPPPAGVEPSKFPTALGQVGDIEFWSPNRGLLITAGNALVPAGLYAYDGVSWHQLSSVCGAHDGRIAWAGADEFWTISDQRPGQIIANGSAGAQLWDVSLCHFLNGQVVGSYALPIEQPDSYQPMDAAACSGPDDCWFGGALDSEGAFHLYWNGSELSVVNAPQDHAIAAMAVDQGQIYESVKLAPGDDYGNESTANPSLLHTIVASDQDNVFHDVFPTDTQNLTCGAFCPPLPEYGTEDGDPVAPDTLAGFALSSDWSPSGDGPASPQLWAVAGESGNRPPGGEGRAHPIVLRHVGEAWTQIVPNLTTLGTGGEPTGVAANPGKEAAWIAMSGGEGATVELLSSGDGGHTWAVSEQADLGPEQGVGARGSAGPIACPAPHECWLATSQGWLFHLTDGSPLTPDSDPFFDGGDGVITYRPPDNGVPEVLPDEASEGDSLASQLSPALTTTGTTPATSVVKTGAKKALVSHVHTRLLKGDVLELTFTLSGTAHIQLLADRHDSVVARTSRETLRKGPHTLKLRLSPRHWPTKLDLRASAA